jgi:hypothetical protein
VAKDREDKEKRLRKAREIDKKEEKVRNEAAKKQDKILEDTRTTRLAITIDDEDEEITIDNLPLLIDDLLPVDDLLPSSTAPAALGGRSKRARAGTVDYRAFAGLSRTRKKIERLNQKTKRKKKAKTTKMALKSPVKKKSRFIDTKAFERK